MTTEIPMRMVESGAAGNWVTSKVPISFGSPLKAMAAEDLGLLLHGQKVTGSDPGVVPNRSGSAPPSMEGSFAAFANLLAQNNAGLDESLADFSSTIAKFGNEEQLRSDPAYIAYYGSKVNLNPRLPPPLISRENRRLMSHIGAFSNNCRFTSFDDSGNRSSFISGGPLFTHKEEPEDDKSHPQNVQDNNLYATGANMTSSSQNINSSAARHKSLVDLIQEDFPRTPSPVYNQPRPLSHGTDESIDQEVQALSLNVSSVGISKVSEQKSDNVDANEQASVASSPSIGLVPADLPLQVSFTCLQDSGENLTLQKDKVANGETGLVDNESMRGLDLSVSDSSTGRAIEEQPSYRRTMPLHRTTPLSGSAYRGSIGQDRVNPQAVSPQQVSFDRFAQGHQKSYTENQSSVRFPPPLYAAAANYMTANTFYPNFQAPGIYAPQYSLGGYALNSAYAPPYMAAYPSHGAFPMPFNTTSGPGFSGRTAGLSTPQGMLNMGDVQHPSKNYGQHAMNFQPSFVDPVHMQYFHNPFEDAYGMPSHFSFVSGGGIGGPVNSYASHNDSTFTTIGDQKGDFTVGGNLGMTNPRKVDVIGSNYHGSPCSFGAMSHYPGSPLSSPVVSSSPVAGIGHLGRRNEMRFSQGSPRNGGMYSGWQGQRELGGFDDSKRNSFLEELKSSNARKFELNDIAGRIVEFSVDQHGSRFIQQKLENCSPDEKAAVFREVLPHASKLMTDVFGNYVIQKFFEHGTMEQRKELADQLTGQMLPLSLQMYGCRVIQKALEVIELDQKTRLVQELDGHVMRCVRDQNGNHVIQKCIECVPTERIGFIISAFRGQVPTLSTHPYGCRVIQRVLEHCSDESQGQCVVDEILESVYVLAQDQYGNYVTQHVLERGKPEERSRIISQLAGKIVLMSQHKYASNVIEKCLEYGDTEEREILIQEIIGWPEENDNLVAMMKDQFANYVIQKILEVSSDHHREILLNCIRTNLLALKKYTYGKHIVAKFEQLSGEDESHSLEQTSS
ncbi:hypothetical protein MLD38_030609 [Melastoma candidum]|uniref:Uncharacterized protein n=1 Tax=Melastoma candidum TaxID=119954 RepID=A0ACB9MM97_9MYRT|nr:hypothetical protein MLD38_030609 [Melastoma candidum]